jgi:hypothetical protein
MVVVADQGASGTEFIRSLPATVRWLSPILAVRTVRPAVPEYREQ